MKKEEKEKFKETMIAVFDNILSEARKQAKEDPLYDFISSKKEWLGDPEEMDIMINHHFKKIIKECVSKTYKTEDHVIGMIYTNWAFFDNNVTGLTKKLEGSACSADRGRTIVKSYIQYKISGTLPVWRSGYHFPKKGTPQQWMDLVDGLANLYYGRSDKYLISFNALIQESALE